MMTRELLQQALDALENFAYHGKAVGWADVATSIRAHLTQPEPKPIAWVNINKHGDITRTSNKRDAWAKTPLYAAQPAPVPLTDEQMMKLERRAFESSNDLPSLGLHKHWFRKGVRMGYEFAATEVPK